MQVIVNISLKHGVLDPQGRAIGRSPPIWVFRKSARYGSASDFA